SSLMMARFGAPSFGIGMPYTQKGIRQSSSSTDDFILEINILRENTAIS
ncbi:uncharacterized protein METZ01_LOCUS294186, partial [marine metagenome]